MVSRAYHFFYHIMWVTIVSTLAGIRCFFPKICRIIGRTETGNFCSLLMVSNAFFCNELAGFFLSEDGNTLFFFQIVQKVIFFSKKETLDFFKKTGKSRESLKLFLLKHNYRRI